MIARILHTSVVTAIGTKKLVIRRVSNSKTSQEFTWTLSNYLERSATHHSWPNSHYTRHTLSFTPHVTRRTVDMNTTFTFPLPETHKGSPTMPCVRQIHHPYNASDRPAKHTTFLSEAFFFHAHDGPLLVHTGRVELTISFFWKEIWQGWICTQLLHINYDVHLQWCLLFCTRNYFPAVLLPSVVTDNIHIC